MCVQGVVDMHAAGWAHMDIKPDNTCMELKGESAELHGYLIDYGSCIKQATGGHS